MGLYYVPSEIKAYRFKCTSAGNTYLPGLLKSFRIWLRNERCIKAGFLMPPHKRHKPQYIVPNQEILIPHGRVRTTVQAEVMLEAQDFKIDKSMITILALATPRDVELLPLYRRCKLEISKHFTEQEFAERIVKALQKGWLRGL